MHKFELPMPVLVAIVAVCAILIVGIGWTMINREPQPVPGYQPTNTPATSATGAKLFQGQKIEQSSKAVN